MSEMWRIDYLPKDDLGPEDWVVYFGTAETYAEQMRLSPRYQEGYWPEKSGVLSLPAHDHNNAEEIRDYLNALQAQLKAANIRADNAERERDEWIAASQETGASNWTKDQWRQLAALAKHRGDAALAANERLGEIDRRLAEGLATQVVTVADQRRVIEGFWDWLVGFRRDALAKHAALSAGENNDAAHSPN